VLYRSAHLHELRKAKGTSKIIGSSAAFLFEVPGRNLPLVVQELQIGGTSYRPSDGTGLAAIEVTQMVDCQGHADAFN
jgi:hypothetical protein